MDFADAQVKEVTKASPAKKKSSAKHRFSKQLNKGRRVTGAPCLLRIKPLASYGLVFFLKVKSNRKRRPSHENISPICFA
jgi:hypothetical protein